MKTLLSSFIEHKDLYNIAITIGAFCSFIINFFIRNTPEEVFGITTTLWFLALIINIIDIHTGIKANTKERNDKGEKFIFESNKAWRAVEKIFVFTVIIAFIYNCEKEIIRLSFPNLLAYIFLYIKFIVFFYVVLIETQSIGENEETRFGKKSRLFILLDSVIEIVNEGILVNLKKILRIKV